VKKSRSTNRLDRLFLEFSNKLLDQIKPKLMTFEDGGDLYDNFDIHFKQGASCAVKSLNTFPIVIANRKLSLLTVLNADKFLVFCKKHNFLKNTKFSSTWTVEKDVFDKKNIPIKSAEMVEKKLAKVHDVEWTFLKPDSTLKSSVKITPSQRQQTYAVVKDEEDVETM